MFSVIAKTNVRILALDQNFFVQYGVYGESGDLNDIEGLEDSISCAQSHIDKYGVPICDYKIWTNSVQNKRTPREMFMDAVNRVIIFNKLNKHKN